jgi:SAM-dependent methyltransferase
MTTRSHWQTIYTERDPTAVGWYRPRLEASLDLIDVTFLPRDARIIDVGGGASTLVDDLLERRYRDITVLDIAPAALDLARTRLGARASRVTWLEGDILTLPLPRHHYDLWHDRAVFHFLTGSAEQQRYREAVEHALRPGGYLIVAAFATDGPTHCSGLPVQRYREAELQAIFGPAFTPLRAVHASHTTPGGTYQPFVYCCLQHAPPAGTAL